MVWIPDRLIVVQREASTLLASFTEQFGGWAEVIMDRRRSERRRGRERVAVERRGRQRRRPLSDLDDSVWRIAGYRLVPRPPSTSPPS